MLNGAPKIFWTSTTAIIQFHQVSTQSSPKITTLTPTTMHFTSLLATIAALSAAVSATPLSERSANRKANEFSSGNW
jgi:hypothetical protein